MLLWSYTTSKTSLTVLTEHLPPHWLLVQGSSSCHGCVEQRNAHGILGDPCSPLNGTGPRCEGELALVRGKGLSSSTTLVQLASESKSKAEQEVDISPTAVQKA